MRRERGRAVVSRGLSRAVVSPRLLLPPPFLGVWRSLAARQPWALKVAGSNPAAPTMLRPPPATSCGSARRCGEATRAGKARRRGRGGRPSWCVSRKGNGALRDGRQAEREHGGAAPRRRSSGSAPLLAGRLNGRRRPRDRPRILWPPPARGRARGGPAPGGRIAGSLWNRREGGTPGRSPGRAFVSTRLSGRVRETEIGLPRSNPTKATL